MKLPDRLHCPNCKGRLTAVSAGISPVGNSIDALRCTDCERTIPIVDGIANFVTDSLMPDRYHGGPDLDEAAAGHFWARIMAAAGDRWSDVLGDTIAFGCGSGEAIRAIAAGQRIRSLMVFDTAIDMLRTCRSRLAPLGFGADGPVVYAMFGGTDVIRDAVADTVIGPALLSGIGDVRAFLAMVHRVLKPGGRAVFVVPNRRYHEAMCLAMAEALVHSRAQEAAWPGGQDAALEILAHTRRLLTHRGDPAFLAALGEKHLFDSEALQDMCGEVGFLTAEMLPLDPDPIGADTTRRICREAGAPDNFTETFGALTASVGKPFFDLLGRQDASPTMLLWLRKAPGPNVRIFSPYPAPPPVAFAGPDAALGGMTPRWSIELLARTTPDGIMVTVGGWCLCNTDVRWVRLVLDNVIADAPVWRPRPDVHDVLNRTGLYRPLNALCSGLASEVLFSGAHAPNGTCSLRLEVILASGLVVTGPTPEMLVMNEQMVIAH
jgi:SAM-dependent methyltransferase